MDIGLLLLLILALSIGWFLGYRSSASQKLTTVQNFLNNWGFNTQPTSSIDDLQSLVQLDSEGFETYIGLGNTYRKRGDTTKAVELHQFLQASEKLSEEQKNTAQLEEALDYQAAGFFDKAEEVVLHLLGKLDEPSLIKNNALKTLVTVYARQRKWADASDTALLLSRYDERYKRVAAHIVAEDIEFKLNSSCEIKDIQDKVDELQKLDANSPRLAVINVKLAVDEVTLNKHAQSAIEQHPESAGLVLQAISKYFNNSQDAIKRFLEAQLPAWSKAAQYNFSLAVSNRQQELAETVTSTLSNEDIQKAIQSAMQFICNRCGFHTGVFAWQCPQCKSWGLLNLNNQYEAES